MDIIDLKHPVFIRNVLHPRSSSIFQRSFRTPATTHKSHRASGGSFFHRRLSSKSPHRNTATNLTQEIHVDRCPDSTTTSSTVTLSSIPDSGSLDSGMEDNAPANGVAKVRLIQFIYPHCVEI